MLMALGLPLPKQIFGHPWMLFGKDKMSKSKGNVIYADELAEQFGVDAVRYYMLSEMPYGQDGAITYETVIARYNSDLANTLGNLVNRTVTMCHKYFDGTLAVPTMPEEVDLDLKACCLKTKDEFVRWMDGMRVADALSAIMDLARRANKYIDETTPWVLAKDQGTLSLSLIHISIDDLMESLRQNNIFDIRDVEYAVVETNGQVSVLQKFNAQTVTPKMLKLTGKDKTPPALVISDGQLIKSALAAYELSEEWVMSILAARQKELADIFLMTTDKSGDYYIVEKEQKRVKK